MTGIQLQEAVKSNYRHINNFEGYYQRWGAVQSFQLWWNLGSPKIKSQYGESRQKFQQECEEVFDTSLKRVVGRVKGLGRRMEGLSGKSGNPIFEDASEFSRVESVIMRVIRFDGAGGRRSL
jgi:CRISPR-associated endonuclease/helicase Cas3